MPKYNELAAAALIALLIVHVVACLKLKAWAILAFGLLVFPVGILHGAGRILGVF